MATTEEKQELVETLKGPRYYRVRLWGYGGEAAYMNVNKETYDFWKPITEEHGDHDLVEYMISDHPDEGDYENIKSVPKEADFLTEKDDVDADYKYPWYEAPGEFCHQNGVEFSSARITVEEIDSDDYSANEVAEVLDGESLEYLLSTVEEDSNYEIEPKDWGEAELYSEEGEYVVQFYSSEKGTFFEGRFETVGEFDIKKLKVVINEYPNGEDIVDGLLYDNVDIENDGGDTNGKGYSASVWKN